MRISSCYNQGVSGSFVAFNSEVNGRWNPEAAQFVHELANEKKNTSRPKKHLRRTAAQAWSPRWTSMLTTAAQRAFAASLLELPSAGNAGADGDAPEFSELLDDSKWKGPPRG